jgi:hypothetical protein
MRLLVIVKTIAGTELLRREAAACTELFCAVSGLKAGVAALQPVATSVPAQGLLEL